MRAGHADQSVRVAEPGHHHACTCCNRRDCGGTRQMSRTCRWLVPLLAVLMCAAPLVCAPVLHAHAAEIGTTPADGDLLATAPPEVSFAFSEDVTYQGDAVSIYAPDGKQVPVEVSGNSSS